VYSLTNKVNGKSYIGQTIQNVNRRISRHKISPFAIGKLKRIRNRTFKHLTGGGVSLS
jgi:hypothetical protein